jgi:glyoxylase-like metal-dependent hydrolase (beta-lactamase superfamily II)
VQYFFLASLRLIKTSRMKKILIGIGVAIFLVLAVLGTFFLKYVSPVIKHMSETTVVNYDKQLTLVIGGGGNSGIYNADSMVLVIDTKMQNGATMLHDLVAQTAGNKPIVIVNTHVHTDHVSGNKLYNAQSIIAGGNYDKDFWIKENGKEGTPTVWVKDSMLIPLGDDTAVVLNLSWSAHTQSDVVVYLQKRKMLFGGDVILNGQSPAMFAKYHADPEGYLRAFDYLEKRFDIDKVVPGHGPIGGKEVIDNYRTFFNDMKAAAADPGKEKELFAKYDGFTQIPFVMSPEATAKCFKKMIK